MSRWYAGCLRENNRAKRSKLCRKRSRKKQGRADIKNRRTRKNAFEKKAYTNIRVQRNPVAPRKPAANDRITLVLRVRSYVNPIINKMYYPTNL